jgi:NodT family efflux transporter outer membrane factor (OMF) lipoprotein
MKTSGRFIASFTLLLAMASAALVLAGCVSTAGIAPTARTIDATALSQDTAPAVDVSDTWWKAFGDARLDELVDRALASNPNLAIARVRIERASAFADAAEAARLPRVDAGLDITREHYSAQGAYPPALAGSTKNSGSLLLTGSWELDAFGRQRAALDAAIGSKRAADADYQAARVLLASNIVRQYVQLARLDDQRDVLQRSLAQREEILGLIRQRVAQGLDTTVELRQGEGAVPEIRAAIEAVDEQRELARHVLSALTAQAPNALSGWTPRLAKVSAVPLPAAIPADLLGRRADIAAARWRVEASTHDLQSAKAQFYPSINLLAFAGFSSIGLGNLLEAGSRQYGIGPAVRLPIFDAGRLRANYKGKAADVDGAVETYNAAVLEALRETADALSSVQSIERQQREQAQALASAESAYELARQRYRAGLGSYLSVLSAETNVLTQRRADNDLKARALDAQALLARALGGGYLQADARVASRADRAV